MIRRFMAVMILFLLGGIAASDTPTRNALTCGQDCRKSTACK
jgi:hypothetical protein